MNTLLKNYYFKVANSEYELQNCYRLRYNVYCEEKGWLPSVEYPEGIESDEYDDKAVHVVAMDEDFKVVGYIRIIRASDFKTLPFESHPSVVGKQLSYPNLAELSRFIIRSDKNGLQIATSILRVVWQTCMQMGLENWSIVCEPSLLRLINKFKYYFEPISGPALYYGGFTQPAILNAQNTLLKWKQSDREAWEFYHKDFAAMSAGIKTIDQERAQSLA